MSLRLVALTSLLNFLPDISLETKEVGVEKNKREKLNDGEGWSI